MEVRNAKFWGDVTKYQQVLINVISNACRYNPPDSHIDVKISCQSLRVKQKNAQSHTSLLSVIVRDYGPGISKRDQSRLFKPFVSVERARSGSEYKSGAGIGLYASKVICEKLGGDICCFSGDEEQDGTVFEFRI